VSFKILFIDCYETWRLFDGLKKIRLYIVSQLHNVAQNAVEGDFEKVDTQSLSEGIFNKVMGLLCISISKDYTCEMHLLV
jgi:hypothetical protein